jgi:hypothetical protein
MCGKIDTHERIILFSSEEDTALGHPRTNEQTHRSSYLNEQSGLFSQNPLSLTHQPFRNFSEHRVKARDISLSEIHLIQNVSKLI